ncbi:MAG: hybrid sensor histidine kinase/response regulator [Burkholderiales bacterium]|nr:hybrid sensor histidine kinase/response regulator [Burkholderiales bacterium]
MLIGLLLAIALPAHAEVTKVSQAWFMALRQLQSAPESAVGSEAQVALPHRWSAQRGAPLPAGRYRLSFEARPRGEMLALRFEFASERALLVLNGALLADIGAGRPAQHVYRAMPLLVPVPPELVVAGRNELEVRVAHGPSTRAMLSAMEVGTLRELEARHVQWRRWLVDIPQNANLLAMALAALLVLVWLQRRQEVALGLFGALYLAGSWRNYGYYAEVIVPAAPWDGIQYVTVIWTATLSMLFAAHYTAERGKPVPWPRLRQALVRIALVLTVAAALAVVVEPRWLAPMRRLTYPLLPLLNLFTAVLFIAHAVRCRGWPESLMAATYTMLVISGVHDVLMALGVFAGLGVFSLPYTMPVLMAVFSIVMLNRVLHAMHVAEDLTLTLERRVADRTRDLAAANEAKGRFIAAASHDLRQPLHAIALMVGLLRERIRYPEVKALVDKVQAAVDGMSGLLTGLLDISRLDGGQVRPKVEEVALQPLLAAVVASELPQAQTAGLRLRLVPTKAVARTDRTLLDSMLRNLVGNAIRYTPSGSVLVGVRRRGGMAWVQVIDTGVGIPEAEQPQVFDEFYRGSAVQRTAGRGSGFGLGLSIVQRSARLLGHPLTLDSVPGRGTRVQLGLPLSPTAARSARHDPGAAALSGAQRQRLEGAFVALLEDDPTAREALASLLNRWGCHVVQAGSLDGLLAALPEHLRPPDLLLCDFRLGHGPDGLQSIARLRAAGAGPNCPALLLTAETTADVLDAARRAGVQVLNKPATPAQLAAALVAQLPS